MLGASVLIRKMAGFGVILPHINQASNVKVSKGAPYEKATVGITHKRCCRSGID
jgi:hypothetical protein